MDTGPCWRSNGWAVGLNIVEYLWFLSRQRSCTRLMSDARYSLMGGK